MKNQIFNKMEEYGWSLESFEDTYDYHYQSIDSWYEYIVKEDYDFTMQDISKQQFTDFVDFMSDFLRAINDIDENTQTTTQDIMIIDKGLNTQITNDIILLNDRGRIGNETREEMLEEIDSFLGGRYYV